MAGYITGDLVSDLWWFIENVTDEDPTRHEQFFALRERVRGLQTGPTVLEPASYWMDAEDAKSIKEGDKLQMLVGGQGEGNEIGVTSYFDAGEIAEVISVDYLARQGLSIGVQADNGVVNLFDALDYNGKYPFRRTK